MRRVIAHPALLLDEFGHAPARPELVAVAERSRAALEASLDLPDLPGRQQGLAAGTACLAQSLSSLGGEGGSPATDRLLVYIKAPRYFGLTDALAQQGAGLEAALLERVEIAFDSGWISHDRTLA